MAIQTSAAANAWIFINDPSTTPGIPAFISLLKQCTTLTEVQNVHKRIKHLGTADKTNRYIANLLLTGYCSYKSLTEAQSVLENVKNPNTKSWNILLKALVQMGCYRDALELYSTMDCDGRCRPDHVTMVSVLSACSNLGDLHRGKAAHERVVSTGMDLNVFVGTAVVRMYCKCNRIALAQATFEQMPEKTVVTWNTLISANAQTGNHNEALNLYRSMDLEPDLFTFSAVLPACSLQEGKKIHKRVQESGMCLDVAAQNSLLSMYVRGGSFHEANKVFEEMDARDTISWNAMIVGYVHHGLGNEALEIYRRMKKIATSKDEQPNAVTYTAALAACTLVSDVSEGRDIHRGLSDASTTVKNTLINLYANCGTFDEAKMVFDSMNRERDLFSWNLMVAVCAKHQRCHQMDELLQLQILEGYQPDEVTYTCILHTYSHLGLLKQGWSHFTSMVQDHFLEPIPIHYRCMLDLLGRAGLLKDAEILIENMPFGADDSAWKCLLSAFKNQGSSGAFVNHVLRSDMDNSSAYVLVSLMQRASSPAKRC